MGGLVLEGVCAGRLGWEAIPGRGLGATPTRLCVGPLQLTVPARAFVLSTPEPGCGRVVQSHNLCYRHAACLLLRIYAAPPLYRYLYDSPLESQLTQVFDSNKRLLYTGDAVPEEVFLVKGDHTARVMLRHDNMALLEKLKNTCLVRGCAGLCEKRHCHVIQGYHFLGCIVWSHVPRAPTPPCHLGKTPRTAWQAHASQQCCQKCRLL